MSGAKKFVIVDSYNFIFRAFHALPKLTNSKGQIANVAFGYVRMLLKYKAKFPDATFIVVADTGTKNFRHDLYEQYKANRPSVDPDLIPQFSMVDDATSAFNIPYLALNGFEADDVIATIRRAVQEAYLGSRVIILSSDKDLFQLIDDSTSLLEPTKDLIIDAKVVGEKMGVMPTQVADYLALTGDSSDNIPGVKGVGPKTAAALLQLAPNIESIIHNKDALASKHPKMSKWINLITDEVLLYKRLTLLKEDVPLPVSIDQLLSSSLNPGGLREFLIGQGFSSILPKVDALFPPVQGSFDNAVMPVQHETDVGMDIGKLCAKIKQDYGEAFILFDIDNGLITSITVADAEQNYSVVREIGDELSKLLQDSSVIKVVANCNDVLSALHNLDLDIDPMHDVLVMAYCADMVPITDLGPVCERYSLSHNVFGLISLYRAVKSRLIAESAIEVYERLDRPMAKILHDMQSTGIMVDRQILRQLTELFSKEAQKVEDKIYYIAGEPFNIGSPRQLASILQDKLGISLNKKSKKTKEYSTNYSVLEELCVTGGHEITNLVLEWRHLTKIINTYSKGLEKYISDKTGRIHTTYRLESTVTGRISSHNPNMQNIPTKSPEGRSIRRAFVASPGCKLISADYSQIELRLLAHIAQEGVLLGQINMGADIHAITAGQIFGIPLDQINNDMRQKAKAVNFGIVYGISSFGLAKQLRISQHEALALIRGYLQKYPAIARYTQEIKQFAREHGYVKTIFGRRCRTPHIQSSNHALRQFAERAAVNAPLQGSAADILKCSLVAIDHFLTKNGMSTRISLQVHDEIILESPDSEVEFIKSNVRQIMEGAVKIDVALSVNVSSGDNLCDLG